MLPVAALAAALGADSWRHARRVTVRPGLPRPLDGHGAAAWVGALLLLAVLVGYRSDRVVLGALGAALACKLWALARGA